MQDPDPTTRQWWQQAFGARYLDVYAHRDDASARAEVAALIALGLRGRLLDLCCGNARHTRAMRSAGLDAFGLDWSPELLGRALRAEGAERLVGRLVRADMRDLPLRAGSLDALTCLFNSFGYFDDEQNLHVLGEMRRVLRRDGFAWLDLMNAARVRDGLVASSERVVGSLRVQERRRVDERLSRVQKDVLILEKQHVVGGWTESVRLYEPDELAFALRQVGLVVERVCGDWDGREFTSGAPRMLVSARAVT
jgi:SAM-dependent methyltransferase